MGTMDCSRRGCENNLCDRYSPEYGYICNDCFKELLESVGTPIEKFMDTPKKDLHYGEVLKKAHQEYVKEVFLDRRFDID